MATPKGGDQFEVRDRRTLPFYQVDNRIIGIYGRLIGPYAIAIYNALAYHAGTDNQAWPSYPTLAEETGMGRTKAYSSVEILVAYRLITKEKRNAESGARTSNIYTLVDPPPVAARLSDQEDATPVHDTDGGQSATRTAPVRHMNGGSPPRERGQSATRTAPVRHTNANKNNRTRINEEDPGKNTAPAENMGKFADIQPDAAPHYKPRAVQLMDNLRSNVEKHNLSMAQFRVIVDRYLEIYGQMAIVDSETPMGDRALSEAQDCCVTLLSTGIDTPDKLAALIDHFCGHGWNGKPVADNKRRTLPSTKQLIEYAGQYAAGRFTMEKTTNGTTDTGNDIDYTALSRKSTEWLRQQAEESGELSELFGDGNSD